MPAMTAPYRKGPLSSSCLLPDLCSNNDMQASARMALDASDLLHGMHDCKLSGEALLLTVALLTRASSVVMPSPTSAKCKAARAGTDAHRNLAAGALLKVGQKSMNRRPLPADRLLSSPLSTDAKTCLTSHSQGDFASGGTRAFSAEFYRCA